EDASNFKYGDREDLRRFGTILAAEAVRVAEEIQTRPVESLKVSSMEVELPLCDTPSAEQIEAELAELRQAVQQDEKDGKQFNWGQYRRIVWAEGTLDALKSGDVARSITGEVQVLRLGDEAVFVAVPGELFVEVGLRIKKIAGGADRPTPFVSAYSNAYVGYLPSAVSCREDGDKLRYEWHKLLGYHSTYSEDMEDVLVGAVEKLL
ncbi:MAG: hypothetical protein KAV00_16880, partial [Phycisphaerae bacterium]|nr:hypothetical protein [Phycisphaerae bacterium]